MSRWRKRLKWAAALVFVAGGAVGGYLYFNEKGKAPAINFETSATTRGPIVARVTATGTLSGRITVQIGSQVSGRIQKLFVDFNSPVAKGQVIAKIEPLLFEAEVARARANLIAAQANFTAAQANSASTKATLVSAQSNLTKVKIESAQSARTLQRSQLLASQKLIALAELETAQSGAETAQSAVDTARSQVEVVRSQIEVGKAQVAAAKGNVEQARAALQLAQVNLTYTTIVSPIQGVVISRNVDVGQTVAASMQAPVLFTVAEDLRRMEVHTNVSEADVGKLQAQMTATFTVDAYPTSPFKGVIREIRNAPQVVQNIVTYDAVIDVDNNDLKLKPGMTANVTFVYADRANVLQVPNAALRFRPPPGSAPPGATPRTAHPNDPLARTGASAPATAPDRRKLWALKDGAPQSVRVRVGLSDGIVTEILEGPLREGDLIITDASTGPKRPPSGGGMRKLF